MVKEGRAGEGFVRDISVSSTKSQEKSQKELNLLKNKEVN